MKFCRRMPTSHVEAQGWLLRTEEAYNNITSILNDENNEKSIICVQVIQMVQTKLIIAKWELRTSECLFFAPSRFSVFFPVCSSVRVSLIVLIW